MAHTKLIQNIPGNSNIITAILPILIFLLTPFTLRSQVSNYDFSDNFLEYKKLNDTQVKLSGCGKSPISEVIIPETVEDFNGKEYTVVSIDENAFSGIKLTSVVIKNSYITEIPRKAFYTSNIVKIDLSGCTNLKTIGEMAFYKAEHLQYNPDKNIGCIILPEGLTTIENKAFQGCNNSLFTYLHIPSTVTKIGNYAFEGCRGLERIELPEALKEIGDFAFKNTMLKEINIPAGLTKIGEQAFANISHKDTQTPYLNKIIIEDRTLQLTIGKDAFNECTRLEKVIAPNIKSWLCLKFYIPYYSDDINLASTPLGYGAKLYLNGDENGDYLTNLVHTGGEIMESHAFSHYKYLESVKTNAKNIGYHAFAHCTALKSVEYDNPKDFTIYAYAFIDCENLEKFEFKNKDNYGRLGGDFFNLCPLLKLVKIPSLEWFFNLLFNFNDNPLFGNATYGDLFLTLDGVTPIRHVTVPESFKEIINYKLLTNATIESLIINHDIILIENSFYNSKIEKIFISNNASVTASDRTFLNIPNLKIIYLDTDSDELLTSSTGKSFTPGTTPVDQLKIFVPEAKLQSYKEAEAWINFKDCFYSFPEILKEPVISSVSMENTTNKKDLKTSESITLKVNIQPENAIFEKINWSYDNSKFKLVPQEEDYSEVKLTVLDEALVGDTKVSLSISQYYHDYDKESDMYIQAAPVSKEYQFNIADLKLGDSNDDNEIDIADIITVLNEIKAQISPESSSNNSFCFINSDIDKDGRIDGRDQAAVTNLALGYEAFPDGIEENSPEAPATRSFGDIVLIDDFTTGENLIGVNLESSKNHVIFQGDFVLPEGMKLLGVETGPKAAKHKIDYCVNENNIVRVIVYSLSNKAFADVEGPLFNLRVNAPFACGNIESENVLLADTKIRRTIPEVYGGNYAASSGIESVATSSDKAIGGTGEIIIYGKEGSASIYTIDGRMIANHYLNGQSMHIPANSGIYVVRVNGSSFKVRVK